MARSILDNGFYMGNSENNGFFGNYCCLRSETWQIHTTNEVYKGVQVFKVKVIS